MLRSVSFVGLNYYSGLLCESERLEILIETEKQAKPQMSRQLKAEEVYMGEFALSND